MERVIPDPGFPGDTGAADPALAAVLARFELGDAGYADVLTALLESRVLVPVVAVAGEVEIDPEDPVGLAREKSSDMAAVLLTGADGRMALLAFTSTEALAAWDPSSRPVPVTARTAAQSAVQEDAAALVLDVAGPVRYIVEGDDLVAMASGWKLTKVGDHTAWLR